MNQQVTDPKLEAAIRQVVLTIQDILPHMGLEQGTREKLKAAAENIRPFVGWPHKG